MLIYVSVVRHFYGVARYFVYENLGYVRLFTVKLLNLWSIKPSASLRLAGPTRLLLCFMIGQIETLHFTWSR